MRGVQKSLWICGWPAGFDPWTCQNAEVKALPHGWSYTQTALLLFTWKSTTDFPR